MSHTHGLFAAVMPRYSVDYQPTQALSELHRASFASVFEKFEFGAIITVIMTILMWVMLVDPSDCQA